MTLPTPRQIIAAAEILGDAQVDAIVGPGGLSGATPEALLEVARRAQEVSA